MKLRVNRRVAAAAALALLLGAAAPAATVAGAPARVVVSRMTIGYTYYNRAGASMAAHDEDVSACASEAEKLTWRQQTEMSTYHSMGQGVLGDALGNAMDMDVAIHGHYGAVAAGVENCMIVRGWRVVILPEAEGLSLSRLGQKELHAKLESWIGSETPHGKIVRAFGNDAAFGTNQRLVDWPQSLDSFELSLKAATGKSFTDYPLEPALMPGNGLFPPPLFERAVPASLLDVAGVNGAPKGQAVVIVSLNGLGKKAGPSLLLERMEESAPGWPSDALGVDARMLRKHPGYAAFVVNPGRWRIAGFGGLTFCLGAPAFTAAAGDVIYIGAFDFAAAELGPDLALTGPKAWLGDSPAAASLKAANYVNGVRGPCGGLSIYALEFKGAPFEPGYHWGSQAQASPGG